MAVETGIEADIVAVARIDVVPTILEVVCRATGMGFAAVARVTEQRWVACAVRDGIAFGLEPGGELEVATTLCNEIRTSGQAVAIDQVDADEVYCRHPTPARYGFQSYISVPIVRSNGDFFGTLCAIDPKPARLRAPEVVGMFELFAQLISLHLDTQDRLAASEAALAIERRDAELREQFIAVLGHDLRNPLAAIAAGVRLLEKEPLSGQARTIAGLMQKSVSRMTTLIGDVLDFARGRLGGGLDIQRTATEPLTPALELVVAELAASWPGREIETHFALADPIDCDRNRVAQLLANLLSNALAHGDPSSPIRVRAVTERGTLELSVANAGEPIPGATLSYLFQPFARSLGGRNRQGLGLGLYIASEIARAHGGTLEVASTSAETRFTFRMPLR